DGAERFFRRVQAAEEFQFPVVERLHAERETVDARRAVAAETLRLDAGRVRLERDFRALLHRPEGGDAFEHGTDRFGQHEGRRAAAEEDGAHGARTGQAAHVFELARQRARPARLVDIGDDVGIEIAVWAFRLAEGPV